MSIFLIFFFVRIYKFVEILKFQARQKDKINSRTLRSRILPEWKKIAEISYSPDYRTVFYKKILIGYRNLTCYKSIVPLCNRIRGRIIYDGPKYRPYYITIQYNNAGITSDKLNFVPSDVAFKTRMEIKFIYLNPLETSVRL
jgi:hypothetical protein